MAFVIQDNAGTMINSDSSALSPDKSTKSSDRMRVRIKHRYRLLIRFLHIYMTIWTYGSVQAFVTEIAAKQIGRMPAT